MTHEHMSLNIYKNLLFSVYIWFPTQQGYPTLGSFPDHPTGGVSVLGTRL